MLNMMEAFSKASEYCEVDLWVKASNLCNRVRVLHVGSEGRAYTM